LCTQVVHFVGLHFLQNTGKVRRVGEITVVQNKILIINMRILVNMVYPLCIKQRCTTLNTMNLVTLFQQELCQVRTVLASNTGDKCFFQQLCLLRPNSELNVNNISEITNARAAPIIPKTGNNEKLKANDAKPKRTRIFTKLLYLPSIIK